VKAAGIGDFRNRLPGIGKKGQTLFNAIGQKVGDWRHRKMFPEQAAAGAFADMKGRGKFFQRNGIHIMEIDKMQHFLQELHIPSSALHRCEGRRPVDGKVMKQREDMALNHQFEAVSFFLRFFIQGLHNADTFRLPGNIPMKNTAGKAFVPHQGEQVFFHDKTVRRRLQKLRNEDEIMHDTVFTIHRNNAVEDVRIDKKAVALLQKTGIRCGQKGCLAGHYRGEFKFPVPMPGNIAGRI